MKMFRNLAVAALVTASIPVGALVGASTASAICLGLNVPARNYSAQFEETVGNIYTCDGLKDYSGAVYDRAADGYDVTLWVRYVGTTSSTWVRRVYATLTNSAYYYSFLDNNTSSNYIVCLGSATNPNNSTTYCAGVANNFGY